MTRYTKQQRVVFAEYRTRCRQGLIWLRDQLDRTQGPERWAEARIGSVELFFTKDGYLSEPEAFAPRFIIDDREESELDHRQTVEDLRRGWCAVRDVLALKLQLLVTGCVWKFEVFADQVSANSLAFHADGTYVSGPHFAFTGADNVRKQRR